jgi:hypothetical protein
LYYLAEEYIVGEAKEQVNMVKPNISKTFLEGVKSALDLTI